MGAYKIDFYEDENGDCPVEEFLDSLDLKMRAKLFRVFDILEHNGPNTRMPYSEYLEDGIFEIRAKQGTNITRVLYFFFLEKKIILTNGFAKKTQKIPRKELNKAKKYRIDYERRFLNEQV